MIRVGIIFLLLFVFLSLVTVLAYHHYSKSSAHQRELDRQREQWRLEREKKSYEDTWDDE